MILSRLMNRLRSLCHIGRFLSTVKKIKALDKTKPYIFFIGKYDMVPSQSVFDWLRANGIKVLFLEEDIKMIPVEEARDVIEYLRRISEQETDKSCDFA